MKDMIKPVVLKSTTEVRDRVLAAIDRGDVSPRSKYVFWCQQSVVWGLWVGSILFGALAIAVLAFVSSHRYYGLYEATHDNFFTFALDALPYVWILVFGGMLLLAIWQLKHTRRGYRFSTVVLGVSSFGFSVILGSLFHIGGFGWSLDMWLGKQAPMYYSQAEIEQSMWQNPAGGRLVGRQVLSTVQPTTTIIFADAVGTRWVVKTVDLTTMDQQFLAEASQVRLLGVPITTTTLSFHACGVFPWMFDQPHGIATVSQERQQFIDRMYAYHDAAMQRRELVERALAERTEALAADSPCHTLPVVERVYKHKGP